MSHSHDHSHAEGNLKVAFFLNLSFTVIEIIGGIFTNSIAILSDALHDLGDTASLGLAWYFEKLSHKKPTYQHTYGYRRFRLLGGLITGFVLTVGLCFILFNSFKRLLDPEPVNATGMMVLAVLGIVVNGAAVLRVKKGTSITERIVSWHLLEDVLGWVAVLLGAVVMSIWDLPIIDPLLSIGISSFIIWNVFRNLKQVTKVFLQTVPENFDLKEFENKVCRIPNVASTHHTHVWSLDGEEHVFSTHLVLTKDSSHEEEIAAKGKLRKLLDKSQFTHVTIEVERGGEGCC
jgi:cobalt-zinc-cadmium efflux system protein